MNEYELYKLKDEIFYQPQGNEIEIAKACFALKYPLMLRGPTGTGKTTFVRYLAKALDVPLVTVQCNEDTVEDTLLGSFNLNGWYDGSATFAIKSSNGAILYLDEIGEARPEAIVVVHGLTDDRRELDIRSQQKKLTANEKFMVVGSYNPGYQMQAKLKPSTLQRFVTLDYGFPSKDVEEYISRQKFGLDCAKLNLKKVQRSSRNLDNKTLDLVLNLANDYRNMAKAQQIREGPSTRLVLMTLGLLKKGISLEDSLECGLINPLTFDERIKKSMKDALIKYVKV